MSFLPEYLATALQVAFNCFQHVFLCYISARSLCHEIKQPVPPISPLPMATAGFSCSFLQLTARLLIPLEKRAAKGLRFSVSAGTGNTRAFHTVQDHPLRQAHTTAQTAAGTGSKDPSMSTSVKRMSKSTWEQQREVKSTKPTEQTLLDKTFL